MKKTILIVLVALVAIMLSMTVGLADTPPANEISPNLSSAFTSWTNPMRSSGLTITYVEAGISVTGSGLYLHGVTETNIEAMDVGGVATIQRWENNTWNTYKQVRFAAVFACSATLDRTVSVESGYYYRMVLTHTAEDEEIMKYCTSTTRSVYVN